MKTVLFFVVLMCSLADVVWAHGPQMQITATEGKIVTRDVLTDDYSPLASPRSVYVMEIMELGGQWYTRPETELNPLDHPTAPGLPTYYSGPGLAYGLGHTFADGSAFTWRFADGLKAWNGVGFVDAGSVELQGYRGGSIGPSGELINPSVSAVSSDSAPFAGITFPALAANYSEGAHSTARWRLLGDGTTSSAGTGTVAAEPADGVYLAQFVLSTTDTSVGESDPFWFVMHKNAPWTDVIAAVSSLGVPNAQVLGVPEPATLWLSAMGLLGLVLKRRTER